MSPFLTTHRLHLTPLSPLHIGCGEDFEPTNCHRRWLALRL